MLLAVTLSEFLVKINVIVGMILEGLGVASLLIAKNLSFAVNKSRKLDKSSKPYVGTKVIGLIMILAGMILIALPL